MTSVIICTHNPRADYLRRTLDSLKAQTLSTDEWELLLIDNASKSPLSESVDLSWHPHGRHIREEELGLTPARLCGIRHARGDMLLFVDDDNVLANDYLARVIEIAKSYPHIRVFGSGSLRPEFETTPETAVEPLLGMLALREVKRIVWTNNINDYSCAPHGAGLCVPREVALHYIQLVNDLKNSSVLDRKGQELFCGGDDLFSWLSVGPSVGFGIFPELRITHLISSGRVRQEYFVRLIHGHAFSHAILRFLLEGKEPKPVTIFRRLRLVAHLFKNGRFSYACRRAELRGQSQALEFIGRQRLEPLPGDKHPFQKFSEHKNPRATSPSFTTYAPSGSSV